MSEVKSDKNNKKRQFRNVSFFSRHFRRAWRNLPLFAAKGILSFLDFVKFSLPLNCNSADLVRLAGPNYKRVKYGC